MVTVFVVGLPLKIYSLSTSKSMPKRQAAPWVFIFTVPPKKLPWNDRNKSGSSHSWFRKLKLIYQGLRLATTFIFVEQPTPSRTVLQTFSILKELKINKCFKWCCINLYVQDQPFHKNDKKYASAINTFVKRILICNKIAGFW